MKKTLISAALMFVFSLTLLFGSTYAWWSEDIVVNNRLVFGNLNIQAEIADPDLGTEEITWYDLESVPTRGIFDVNKLEPGSSDARFVRISNKGNIPLAYKVNGSLPQLTEDINYRIRWSARLLDSNFKICDTAYDAFGSEFMVLQPGESHIYLVYFEVSTELGNWNDPILGPGWYGENAKFEFTITIEGRQIAKVLGDGLDLFFINEEGKVKPYEYEQPTDYGCHYNPYGECDR